MGNFLPATTAELRRQPRRKFSNDNLINRLSQKEPCHQSQPLPRKILDLNKKMAAGGEANHLRHLSMSESGGANSPRTPCTPDNNGVVLSEAHLSIVRKQWAHVDRLTTENNIGVRIYLRVFDLSPELRKAFTFGEGWAESLTNKQILYSQKFQHQAKKFVSFLDRCVKELDKPEDLKTYLFELGQAHAGYVKTIKIRRKHWDAFTEAMLECLVLDVQRSAGRRHSRLIGEAWRQLILWINDSIREGYEAATRSSSRAVTPVSELEAGLSDSSARLGVEDHMGAGRRRFSLPVPEHNIYRTRLPQAPGMVGLKGFDKKHNYSLRFQSAYPRKRFNF